MVRKAKSLRVLDWDQFIHNKLAEKQLRIIKQPLANNKG
jgi:hypothetical protein